MLWCWLPQSTPYKPVRSTMALMKMVSSLRYGLLPASLASGQKSGQPLAMFISLIGRWKEVEVTSGRKASIMCSLLFWSKSIRVTWGKRRRGEHQLVLWYLLWIKTGAKIILKPSYLLTERPFEQRVALSPHDDKEQWKVCPSTRPVAVQIQPQTHFVSVFAGVKRCEEMKKKNPECEQPETVSCENRRDMCTPWKTTRE